MYPITFKNKSIIAISDTHGKHRSLTIPKCDFLICCGDVCNDGNELEIKDFFEWFSNTPAQYKLFLSGNHDYPFVFEPMEALSLLPNNVIFIEGKVKTIAGISFYGIKSQQNLFDLPEIINKETDFLISHIPPKAILDDNLGCLFLLDFVKKQKPKFHIFGHIHKFSNQSVTKNKTKFINACSFKNTN